MAATSKEAPLVGRGETLNPGPVSLVPSVWTTLYGEKHRLHWIRDFPQGIVPPRRIRIYRRCQHFLLQWWDPQQRRNLCVRVDGDLVDVLSKARHIEDRLTHFRSSGQGQRRLRHRELAERYLADLARRADCGEVAVGTVCRYRAALRHYADFTDQTSVQKAFPFASAVNREFRLAFAAFLNNRQIGANGHPNARPRHMKAPGFVEDVVRGMFLWAADVDRGNLLPEGFRVPFARVSRQWRPPPTDQTGEPDITLGMAAQFVGACDAYQLALFAPLMLYGLRPAEICFLFREYIVDGWLNVPCNDDIYYRTKSRRAKRFPLVDCMRALWDPLLAGQPQGLLYERRPLNAVRDRSPLLGASLAALARELQRRHAERGDVDAVQRVRLRNQLLKEAGGICYDHVEAEFTRIARKLGWPAAATAKDFRHLFSTCLANAGMPEPYRKYLMGHSPGRGSIITYTHLNKIREHYEAAVRSELRPLAEAVARRAHELGLIDALGPLTF